MYIEKSFDTLFNMGYGSENSPIAERVKFFKHKKMKSSDIQYLVSIYSTTVKICSVESVHETSNYFLMICI